MQLSEHFTLQEFIRSETASRLHIDNTPTQAVIDSLTKLADRMEQVRTLLTHPIRVSSGYRCSALNKAVGSKPNSLHVQGLACDFTCPEYGTPKDIIEAIKASAVEFDKCILEFYNPHTGDGWVHLQLGRENRRQVLTINQHGTFAGIVV